MNFILKVLLATLFLLNLFASPIQSASGYAGSYRCCQDGEKGVKGDPGSVGPRGSRGDKGDRGIPGRCSSQALESVTLTSPTGDLAASVTANMDGVRGVLDKLFETCVEDFIIDSGNTLSSLTLIKGEKGEKGDNGMSIMGVPGLPGAPGPTGPQGMIGAPGAMGAQGVKGDMGEKGEKGCEGPVGPVGNTGNTGPVGPAGLTGFPGPKGESGQSGQTGLVYTRWGESTCPPNSALLYDGIITQAATKMANLLCVPKDNPIISPTHQHITTTPTSHITRMEPFLYTNHLGVVNTIPCARCYDSSQSMEFMFPGSTTCPTDWTRQYHGHLMTSFELSTTDVLCGDKHMTRHIQWGNRNSTATRNDMNLVEMDCGKGGVSTLCQGYETGQAMPCVVCSK